MGSSAIEYSVVTGLFAGRMNSSSWLPRTGCFKMKKCGRGPDNTSQCGPLWQTMLVIMILGSGAHMWGMLSAPQNEDTTSMNMKGRLSGTVWAMEAGVRERTAGQVRVLLMLSGNVERNPGPTTEISDALVSGLADLVGQAPAGMRDVLCARSPD